MVQKLNVTSFNFTCWFELLCITRASVSSSFSIGLDDFGQLVMYDSKTLSAPLRSPGYNTFGPQLALSADGDTLSVHSRSSLRVSSKKQENPSRILIYANFRDGIHLHRLADEFQPNHVPTKTKGGSSSFHSLFQLNDKYEADIHKMARELEGYRQTISKLTRKQEDYSHVMEMFQNKLSQLSKHVDKSLLRPDDLSKLRQEIDQLRLVSTRLAQGGDEGAGELLRQPSLESVASLTSHRSSISSSSKSSRTDKSSLNSFGKTKKSWVRKKNWNLCQLGARFKSFQLDEVEVDELKKKLEDRDVALTDIRLDALDKAREVDILRETVNRLKHENKQLKNDMSRLLAGRCSRASSQASIPILGDEEPVYEAPSTSACGSYSSNRSFGCNSVKVTVNVDLRGIISNAICPDNEIIIGFLDIPGKEVSWEGLDQQIFSLFEAYIARIDPDRHLGLHCSESVIGYQMGEMVREKGIAHPGKMPGEVLTPTTTVRMFLRGAAQYAVDSLVLECLFPRTMLEQLLKFLLSHRRLVLSGATGIGKSNLARQLAAYLSVRIGLDRNGVVDVKIPENASDKGIVKVEKQLEGLLRSEESSVILIDNIPRHRIAFVSSVFSSVELNGPFVICTVNRACQLPEMQVHHNFKMFFCRFLRRRIVEAEFRLSRQTPPELVRVIQFLPIVLQAVNSFIEKANSLDVTIGPRIFLQCPLGTEESRTWFVQLWNQNIVPYMIKVAREGVKVLGRCGSFEDPTDIVCDHWPWLEGPSGEECLHRLSIKETIAQAMPKQPFNPLDTLIRLQASRNATIDNI
uniref:AAA domain-containing protein n=1 Tax=Angiostrongylus cantonensis TaxID=6313 RepID=A0A158P9P0_ANGCA